MSPSDQPSGGYVLTLILLVSATFALVIFVAWQQRQGLAARQLEQQLRVRLDQELRREVARLESATLAGRGPAPPRPALVMQALDNLLRQARLERLALEQRRLRATQLLRRSTGARQQELREALRQLSSELRRAREWVRLLEAQIPEASRLRDPFSSPAAVDTLPRAAIDTDDRGTADV